MPSHRHVTLVWLMLVWGEGREAAFDSCLQFSRIYRMLEHTPAPSTLKRSGLYTLTAVSILKKSEVEGKENRLCPLKSTSSHPCQKEAL